MNPGILHQHQILVYVSWDDRDLFFIRWKMIENLISWLFLSVFVFIFSNYFFLFSLKVYQVCWKFYQECALNFIRFFLCIHCDDPVIFILCFVNVVYHINCSVNIETFLHPWHKSTWLWCMILFRYCWIQFVIICWGFCIYIHQKYCPIIFFFCSIFVWFWYQGGNGLRGWF